MDELRETVKILQDGLQEGDSTVIAIFVAVLVVLLTILIFVCKGGTNKRRGVLLMGICDAGKTLLFNQIVNKTFVETYTSMKSNVGTYEARDKAGKKLQVMDIPGHERVRGKFVDDAKSLARGIIYVIDSITIQKDLKDVAEFLYTTLTDRVVSNNAPHILIACNKQDKMRAKGAKVVKEMLEKEINTVRKTKSAALMATDESGSNNTFLGKPGKDFSFTDIKPFKVEFVECSALGTSKDETSITEIESWLQKIA